MMKQFLHWKWLAILAGVTVLAVGITLGVCFSRQEETLAPGFTYANFYNVQQMGDTSYVISPTGDLLAIEGTYSYLYTSMDKETLVWGWGDKTFTVASGHGVQYVGKTVNRLTYAALFISHDGEVIYFIDNEEFNDSQNSLWRYDVASGEVERLDTILTYLRGGMVSPGGNYFAMLEVEEEGSFIHLYDKEKRVQSYATDDTVQLYFVTDNGTVFYGDMSSEFQSVHGTDEPVVYEELQYDLGTVLFNKDCTEILANGNGCHFYQLENDVVKTHVQLKEAGGLAFFMDTNEFESTTMKVTGNTNSNILDIVSFREINLKDMETGERVKLTDANTLVYQEGSGYMNGQLVPGGAFLVYIDANGDYFYTETDDVNGEYKLLWEASKYEGTMKLPVGISSRKSIYYTDMEEGNLHYVKDGKDIIICPADIWSINNGILQLDTDTIYFTTADGVYYSNEGGKYRKLFEIHDVFPKDIEYFDLSYTNGQVYCNAWSDDYSTVAFYKLYADGTYQLMEPAA